MPIFTSRFNVYRIPFFRLYKKKLKILFIHIPRTAGSSIEDTFILNSFEVSYFYREHIDNHLPGISPQHYSLEYFLKNQLYKDIDFIFTVVRHPITRFLSAFAFNLEHSRMGEYTNINDFVNDIFEKKISIINTFDNHFNTMTFFLDGYKKMVKIFRFEELILFNSKINSIFQKYTKEVCFKDMLIVNQSKINDNIFLSKNSIKMLGSIYKDDFINFNYDLDKKNF